MGSDRSEIDPKRISKLVDARLKSSGAEDVAAAAVKDPFIKDQEIQLDTWPRKIIALALIFTASGFFIYHSWWPFLAAWITRDKPNDPAIYELAVRYDPKNADYHFTLAQIYNYSTGHINLPRAGEEYEEAVRLNPYRTLNWLELSKYYEEEGNVQRSRNAMVKALEDDPNDAQTHWTAANLYVRLNDSKAADFELRRSSDLDPLFTPQVLDLAWRLYADPDLIMSTDIPNTHDADLIALDYFILKKSSQGAALAWNRLKAFDTKPQDRFTYVNYLIGAGQPRQAWDVFATGLSNPSPDSNPPFFNSGFESEPLGGGFDWNISSSDDAEALRDTTTVKDGMASLIVTFSGKQNPDYNQVSHLLPLEKGKKYLLKFWMKTDDITTNEGMFVVVDGQASAKQVGSTSWQEFAVPFTATSDLVQVALRRVPSKKFDNLLKGKVWLDSFSITAAS